MMLARTLLNYTLVLADSVKILNYFILTVANGSEVIHSYSCLSVIQLYKFQLMGELLERLSRINFAIY
jgi:hypothetical protein